jgi:hypothetical protein
MNLAWIKYLNLLMKVQTYTSTSTVKSMSTDQFLTHKWPFENGTMKDVVGFADMTQGNLTSFTVDRFGCANSALALNGGWTQVPLGVYFDSPEFTISFWILPQTIIGQWVRVIDFSSGTISNDIVLAISDLTSPIPSLQISLDANLTMGAFSSQNLTLGQWQFLAVTFNGTNSYVYLNGQLIDQKSYTQWVEIFHKFKIFLSFY